MKGIRPWKSEVGEDGVVEEWRERGRNRIAEKVERSRGGRGVECGETVLRVGEK